MLSPVVSGALRDATGSWGAPILLDGALMGLSCVLLLGVGRVLRVRDGGGLVGAMPDPAP